MGGFIPDVPVYFLRMYRILLFILFLIAFISCKKDQSELPADPVYLPTGADIRCIFISGPDTIFLCGGDDASGIILRSVNGGENFEIISNSFNKPINSMWFIDSNKGFAVDNDVIIYKTTDGGFTWNGFYPAVYPLSVNRNLRSIMFVNDSTGFVCGGKNFGNGLIYKTTNGGATWTFTEFSHELRGIWFNEGLQGTTCGYGTMMQSNDGGQSWDLQTGFNEYFTGLKKDPEGNLWACTFSGDMYSGGKNGDNWYKMNDHSDLPSGFRLNCIDAKAGVIVGAGPGGSLIVSKDNGAQWSVYSSFNENTIYDIKLLSSKSAIACGKNGSLYKINF
jgi:photosystem II stability/assembly factor-like uncharacterized protein